MADPIPGTFGRRPSLPGLPVAEERTLVERAAHGDQRAIGRLYDAYVSPLYRFCLARVGNETDAEDLTEEIFLKVMRAVSGFEWRPLPLGADGGERSPFRAWLFRIARNHVVSHYRRNASRPTAGEVPDWIEDDRRGPAEMAELAMTVDEVFAVVEQLPQAQREVILLRFGSGLSVAETAEALEKNQTNVKVLQHKGVKRLKELLGVGDDLATRLTAELAAEPGERER
ncbi:MAG: RNA polymerase sigma factor [Chloroflexi bacterium]|nr:RNA polymerase sigma factor [Chloroflexota bacterium]